MKQEEFFVQLHLILLNKTTYNNIISPENTGALHLLSNVALLLYFIKQP